MKTPVLNATAPTAPALSLADRLLAHWRFKLVAGTWLTVGFLSLYLLVQRCAFRAPLWMPATALDRWLGFHPGLVWLYESLWLYMPIGPWLMAARRDLAAYCRVFVGLSLAAFAVFLVWPTAVARPSAPLGPDAWRLLTAVDGPGNACPSLHAAMAVFSAACLAAMLAAVRAPLLPRALNLVWCVAILYAALAVKQHLLPDLAAGVALGLVGAAVWRRDRGSALTGLPPAR